MMQIGKFGDCPKVNGSASVANECVDSCHGYDYRCLGVQKCCAHKCGAKCMLPSKLEIISDR